MKIVCITQFYPQDDCGDGPNDYTLILSEKHCCCTSVFNSWELPKTKVDFFECDTTDNEVYRYCLNELIKYFENKDNETEKDEFNENIYLFEAGILKIQDDEFDKLNLSRESACRKFANSNVKAAFDVSDVSDEKKSDILKCLLYILSLLDSFGLCGFPLADEDFYGYEFDAEAYSESIKKIIAETK